MRPRAAKARARASKTVARIGTSSRFVARSGSASRRAITAAWSAHALASSARAAIVVVGGKAVGLHRLVGRADLVRVDAGGNGVGDPGDDLLPTVQIGGLFDDFAEPPGRGHPIPAAARQHQVLCRQPVLLVPTVLGAAGPRLEQGRGLVDSVDFRAAA